MGQPTLNPIFDLNDYANLRPKLTKREKEVIQMLVATGGTSKAIADALYVSKRTVDFHFSNIFDKLKVSNRVQAVLVVYKWGYLDE